jgi:hypothetical protein
MMQVTWRKKVTVNTTESNFIKYRTMETFFGVCIVLYFNLEALLHVQLSLRFLA